MKLILASGSPRRKELLSLITDDFTVSPGHFDESLVHEKTPAMLAERLAREKCLEAARRNGDAVVIGSDTVVEADGRVFGKPADEEDARRMIRTLSGKTHFVHTGVCICGGGRTESFADTCRVTFFEIDPEDIERYIRTAEPYDKAGAYAIQGHAALWIDRIEGDYYTIMGLPVSRTSRLLKSFL